MCWGLTNVGQQWSRVEGKQESVRGQEKHKEGTSRMREDEG